MTTNEDVRAVRDAVRALTAEPWQMSEDGRLVYSLEDYSDPRQPWRNLKRNHFSVSLVRGNSHATGAEITALARLVLALPQLLATAQRFGEFVGPNGDRHCSECRAVGDADENVTMVHDLGCLTGAALSLALGSKAHDA